MGLTLTLSLKMNYYLTYRVRHELEQLLNSPGYTDDVKNLRGFGPCPRGPHVPFEKNNNNFAPPCLKDDFHQVRLKPDLVFFRGLKCIFFPCLI